MINRLGYDEKECVKLISSYQLPTGDLLNKCQQIQAQNMFDSNTYRRLLPANYADGLHKVRFCIYSIPFLYIIHDQDQE